MNSGGFRRIKLSSNLTLRFRRSPMPDTCHGEVTKRGADADWEPESLSDIYPELFQSDSYYSCLRVDESCNSCFTHLELGCSTYQVWEQDDGVGSFLLPIAFSSVWTESISDPRYGGFLESDAEHAFLQQNLFQTAEFAFGENARENIVRCRAEFAVARNASVNYQQRENLRGVTPASSQLSLAVYLQNAAGHATHDLESMSTDTFVESCLVAVPPSASPEQPAGCQMISASESSRASSNTSALKKLPARPVDEATRRGNKRTRRPRLPKVVDVIADTIDSKRLASNGEQATSSAAVTYQDSSATKYIATRQRDKTEQQAAGASSSSSLQNRDQVNENLSSDRESNKCLAKKVRKGKRHRNGTRLPARAVRILQDWTAVHCTVDSAYPSKEAKTELAESTGLRFTQVSNWLSCWRDKHNLQRQTRNMKTMATAGGTSTRARLKI